METYFFPTLLLIILLHLTTIIHTTFSLSIATDQNTLLAIKNTLNTLDPNNVLAKNWSSNGTPTSVCYWIGVSCGVKHKRVTALRVSGYDLTGPLSPHLGNLTFLRYLNLSSNRFTGLIPSEMSYLRRLREIDLGENLFNGEIPSWFGDLPQLKILILRYNRLSGKIPSSLFNNNNNSCKLQILDMQHNKLNGSIPEEIGSCSSLRKLRLGFTGLMGSIPDNMCNDHFSNMLTVLELRDNQLEGRIPPNIWKCRQLEILNLGENRFNGEIPSEIGRLSKLKMLGLWGNVFEGGIPAELGMLPQLEMLDLTSASLTGPIPNQFTGNFTSLRIIGLYDNQLTGPIQNQFRNCNFLKELYLQGNRFTGSLPVDMFNHLPNLTVLDLSRNLLEGRIPPSIGKCRELVILDLSFNSFSGEIPSEIGSLSMLRSLHLGSGNNFKGGIPAEFGRLSRLNTLSIENASLTGPIPKQLWNCTSLTKLDLSYNYLRGDIEYFSLFDMRFLALDHNQLTGEIPSSINNASKIIELRLGSNSFSGSIPNFGSLGGLYLLDISENNMSGGPEMEFLASLSHCPFLDTVKISGNPLNGILPPASIGHLPRFFAKFYADNCNITGVILSSIGNLTGLQRLSLRGNQLSGFIPPTIGKLNKLQSLLLRGNRLQGHIPLDICRPNNIYELDLNDNLLTGPIPECLGDRNSLIKLYLGSNNLNSTIPSNLWNHKDLSFLNLSSNNFTGQLSPKISGLKALNYLDLSHNQFSGDIPSQIGDCLLLVFLSLSNNKFKGSIPPSLGNTRGLTTLDLSNNNLSGSIPNSFKDIQLLQYINVSYNKLEGEIPTEGPFVNFTAQAFLNNSALCGPIKFQVPLCPIKDNRTSRLKKAARLMKYILPPFLSVISVATIIILVLITRQRQKLKRLQVPADTISPGATWRRFTYIELVRGTNHFSIETNLLGRGSFGSVFKATLSDGFSVAVKVFNLQSERALHSFDTECEILSTIRHRNLVRIIGCCSNTEFKALVLEHMPNGSLEKWLHSENCCLNLTQRLQIAIEVALALEYLHHHHTFQIVHCDIKPSNVLLDEDLVAHLADFGISQHFENGQTMVHTNTLATIGYTAPEYGSEGKVSTNADVYSYGILLLEMFTKKKPTDDMFSGEMSLREWVYRALQENAVPEVVAPDMLLSREDDQSLTANEEQCFSSIFSLAMKCLATSPEERINMTETARALQSIKDKVLTVTTRRRRYA